jgi:hypothetical protein
MYAARLTARPPGRAAAGRRVRAAGAALAEGVLRAPGEPMRAGLRRDMERRFGFDFGAVRLHADPAAAASAAALGARAWAFGPHVVLGDSADLAGTGEGRRVLAHELAHVVQQHDAPPGERIIRRMATCPGRLAGDAPTPPGWKSYFGPVGMFHCGFRTILEDRSPTPDDPENECVYDHSGALVDQNHPYAGCRGTPDQYDSRTDPLKHTFIDSGGIVRAGADAFITSRVYDINQSIASVISAGVTAGNILSGISDALGSAIAVSVLSGIATCDPANWIFRGLPARSVRHLNMMGAVLSFMWNGSTEDVLRNLTRRLDSYPIANLLAELARDINAALAAKGIATQVSATTLGVVSLHGLVDWLQVQGLLAYRRSPEAVARERLAAARAATASGQ